MQWHLTVWLEDALTEIHLLQGEVSQSPAGALTWISRDIAERSKTIVFLLFVSVEWMESEWKHVSVDMLHHTRLGANVDF